MEPEMLAPDGVKILRLEPHGDSRGVLTELFRSEWAVGMEPVQWNLVRSRADVLRGFHVHVRHSDYLILVDGKMLLGLKDLRDDSPTSGAVSLLTATSDMPQAFVIPPGVGHGFYFPEPSIHVYAVSHYWNMDDELGCRWDDPDLGVDWPTKTPELSERDINAPSYAQLIDALRRRRLQMNRQPA